MKCKRAQRMIMDYVNEVLGAEGERLVQEHTAECDSCRQELDMQIRMMGLIENVKTEYPPTPVWENFLPDLHRRIQREAALVFKSQQQQRIYLLPITSIAVVVLIVFAFLSLRLYPSPEPIRLRKTGNIAVTKDTAQTLPESDSEPSLVAGIISRNLITESEAEKLRKLRDFKQPETSLVPDYYSDYTTPDTDQEVISEESYKTIMKFLLENEFSEFDENDMMESDDSDLGTM